MKVEYFEEAYSWKNPEDLYKVCIKQQKEIERLKEELEFEKATNKELISTGAELENKLYEEQDKNKRLNNIIKEVREYIKSIDKVEDSDKE